MLFTQIECLAMISSKSYVTNTMSYPLILNNMNSIKYYTHGGVTYTGTNIHCTGESLRLENGKINSNMIRQEHIIIAIRKYQLIEVEGTVIDPITQVKLAQTQSGNARSGTKTFIWNYTRKQCKLMKVMDIIMESNNGKDWVSHEHKIKITVEDSFHHAACNIKISKTNIKNIYLTDQTQQDAMIEDVDSRNVDLSAELNSRFGFIYDEINKQLFREYKLIDPVCHRFQSSQTNEAQRIGNDIFIKSLGDISISFRCKEVQIAPNPNSKCYTMAPMTDINGEKWFLNPNNRILTSQAVEVPCNTAILPVYRNENNQMVTFSPGRKIINPERSLPNTQNTTSKNQGLYSQDLVKDWLESSYLQHWNKFSYSTLVSIFCQSDECKSGHTNLQAMSEYVGGALATFAKKTAEGMKWGINLEKIGGYCSIVVVIMLIVYTAYGIIAWAIRFTLFNREEIKLTARIWRATFTDIFLITKDQSKTNQDTTTGGDIA